MVKEETMVECCESCKHWEANEGPHRAYGFGICGGIFNHANTAIWTDGDTTILSTHGEFYCAAYEPS